MLTDAGYWALLASNCFVLSGPQNIVTTLPTADFVYAERLAGVENILHPCCSLQVGRAIIDQYVIKSNKFPHGTAHRTAAQGTCKPTCYRLFRTAVRSDRGGWMKCKKASLMLHSIHLTAFAHAPAAAVGATDVRRSITLARRPLAGSDGRHRYRGGARAAVRGVTSMPSGPGPDLFIVEQMKLAGRGRRHRRPLSLSLYAIVIEPRCPFRRRPNLSLSRRRRPCADRLTERTAR
jgi:hypothetical protein